MPSRDAFRPGQRITRDELNKRLAAPPAVKVSGPRVNSPGRGAVVITDEEDLYFRITAVGSSPTRYAWREVLHDRFTGAWSLGNRTGGLTDDPAFEVNGATLSAGSTVYRARRARSSGVWLFSQGGGGGGAVDISASDVRVLVLGTYDEYKNCPGVPPKPPTIKTSCGEDTGVLCVPAYAYAVYVRCGYIWIKIGDTRDFQVWANGLNGGTLSAMRRLYMPTFGGDVDPVTGLPDPDAPCMGLALLEYCSQGSLTCTCPDCLSTPGACLTIKFRTLPRPCPRPPSGDITCGYGCASAFQAMDDANAWDKDFELEIDPLGCFAGAATPDGLFSFEWQFASSGFISCDWGPDVLDPCDPCRHWGRIFASIEINGGLTPNCGSPGIWTGEFLAAELCRLICDCGEPVKPFDMKLCNNCSNGTTAFHWIDPESIEIACCPELAGEAISGGSASSVPADAISGGDADTVPADAYSGGGA